MKILKYNLNKNNKFLLISNISHCQTVVLKYPIWALIMQVKIVFLLLVGNYVITVPNNVSIVVPAYPKLSTFSKAG